MSNQVVVDSRFESEPAKVVLKYPLDLVPEPVEMPIPVGARLLHVEFIQGSYPYQGEWLMWYEVDISKQGVSIPHVYQAIATGVPFPKMAKHISTGLRFGSGSKPSEVWHLYEYPTGAKVVDVE